ncbi:unnamed protein product, partial [Notodromas monacha]
MKKALITGINGQDGSYLSEFLLEKGYEVHGTLKRNSVSENQTSRLDNVFDKIKFHYADLTDLSSLIRIISEINPDEIYNLAAQSHVRISFDQPIYTANVTGLGTLNILEAVKLINPSIKIYQASSSEMFGNNIDEDGYQRETTPMNPVSPYGCAKVFSYNISRNYRNSYNMFVSNGILFNHESPRRGTNFVTNKVCKEAVKIKLGLSNELKLGNLDATRDWGHAKDYVEAMWLILQEDSPGDFVCSTGISHSVKDLVEYVFNKLELDWTKYVKQDEKFYRPEELNDLKGDSKKLRELTNWLPKYTFKTMLDEMEEYYNLLKENEITICSGPAGVGKSYISMKAAVDLLMDPNNGYEKLIIVRPAVEAEEKLGSLPGNLEEKLDPYIFPSYYLLNKIIGKEAREELKKADIIEVFALAYMRGMNIDNSILIFEESQNSTPNQMKLLLTRIGFNRDLEQTDRYKDKTQSGLYDALQRFKNVNNIGVYDFRNAKNVRNPLISKILD